MHKEIKDVLPGEPDGGSPELREVARSCLRALRTEGTGAPALRATVREAGTALVEALERVAERGVELVEPDGTADDDRGALAHQQLVDLIAGPPGTATGSAVRRAAERVAHELLDGHDDVTFSQSGRVTLSDDLFCLLHRLFFEELVIAFIEAVVVEPALNAVVPGVTLLDPFGQLREALSEEIVELLPSPCAEREEPGRRGRSIFDVARDLLPDTVTSLLEERPASGEAA
ncbi:hypothetical protein [Saccharopolyspora hordei]|uniref:Uncharacterized protein n=1 Tax=Saccharopolyspora hordei TaxID=1838 RepID=A0A853AG30_9PSEU|nr:hypothetical protein [Saccharopolyspora hordei]NYI83512.1 hypothetical protein [Saccharopolyspora hordei]